MKAILTHAGENTLNDEHVPHEVRAYDGFNRLMYQQVMAPGSRAEEVGLTLYKSKGVARIVIRALFPLWPEQMLVKKMLIRDRRAILPEGIDIDTYRVVYYGPDDFAAQTTDLDEKPNNAVLHNYFRNHRHISYAVVLAYNIPVEGEGMIVGMLENPNFRVKKTIHALNDKSTKKDVQAYLQKSLSENIVQVANQIKIESALNSARNISASLNWGYQTPKVSLSLKDMRKKNG